MAEVGSKVARDELMDQLLALVLSQRDKTWRVDEKEMKEARKAGLIAEKHGSTTYFMRCSRETALSHDHGVVMTEGGEEE